ncbi:MAG: hypothetical protein OEM52_11375 [bacterium]|nr:hypothetical protein [bacterium]
MSEYKFESSRETVTVHAHRVRQGEWKVSLHGQEYHLQDVRNCGARISFRLDGKYVEGFTIAEKSERTVGFNGDLYALEKLSLERDRSADHAHHGTTDSAIRAPMPGKVIKLYCNHSDRVLQKAPLVVLEAMKMEFVLAAPRDGVVSEVICQVGDQVELGDVLVSLQPLDTSEPSN